MRAFLARAAGKAEADDLAQDAFVKAWLRARDFRGQGSYRSWLFGIGWRVFLDAQKRERRRRNLWSLGADETEAMTAAASGAAVDIDRLFLHLTSKQRAALTLCDGHGWTHGEAAEILGLPMGSVKSLILRAKRKLAMLVAGGECDDPE